MAANLALIADAPALLAALERLANAVGAIPCTSIGGPVECELAIALPLARAALNQAKGVQS